MSTRRVEVLKVSRRPLIVATALTPSLATLEVLAP